MSRFSAWIVLALLLASTPSRADLAATRTLLGGRAGKIVAVNKAEGGTLWLLDVDSDAPRRLSDEINCSGPLLSPDGTRVTYHQNGAVFVQALDGAAPTKLLDGYDPHFWRDDAGDEWIYFTTAGNFSSATRKLWWPDANGVKTYRHRLKDGHRELVVDWKASAGPSRDGKMIGAGYATMILFEEDGTPHLLNNQQQGCNASMYPGDNSGGRYFLMHLELPHDTFCYRDKDDNRLWYVFKPEGTEEWQNPEWSNHPDFCMATARESNTYYGAWVIKISEIDGGTGQIRSGAQGMAQALLTTEGDWAEPSLWLADSAPSVEPTPPAADGGSPPPSVVGADGGGAGAMDGGAGPVDGASPSSVDPQAPKEGGAGSGLGAADLELAGGCAVVQWKASSSLPFFALVLLFFCAWRRRR